LADLVAAMKPEYEAIAASGFQLRLDLCGPCHGETHRNQEAMPLGPTLP
jgi:hypothetical protein